MDKTIKVSHLLCAASSLVLFSSATFATTLQPIHPPKNKQVQAQANHTRRHKKPPADLSTELVKYNKLKQSDPSAAAIYLEFLMKKYQQHPDLQKAKSQELAENPADKAPIQNDGSEQVAPQTTLIQAPSDLTSNNNPANPSPEDSAATQPQPNTSPSLPTPTSPARITLPEPLTDKPQQPTLTPVLKTQPATSATSTPALTKTTAPDVTSSAAPKPAATPIKTTTPAATPSEPAAKTTAPAVTSAVPEPVATMLNTFFTLKKQNPQKAQAYLLKLIETYPRNVTAQIELGYQLIDQNQLLAALKTFQYAQQLAPEDQFITLQIAYLYASTSSIDKAKSTFNALVQSSNSAVAKKAKVALAQLTQKGRIKTISARPTGAPLPGKSATKQTAMVSRKTPAAHEMLSTFFALKKLDPKKAREYLMKIIELHPNNVTARLELGYFQVDEGKLYDALATFKTAQKLDPKDQYVTLQIAYLYSGLNQQDKANPLFETLATSKNPTIAKKAKAALSKRKTAASPQTPTPAVAAQTVVAQPAAIPTPRPRKKAKTPVYNAPSVTPRKPANTPRDVALTNTVFSEGKVLAQPHRTHSKLLPNPWFADVYAAPFYTGRFNTVILPVDARFGLAFGPYNQWNVYGRARATRDTESGLGAVGLPQTINNNLVILSAGLSFKPFKDFPFKLYGELGRAYQIVSQPGVTKRWHEYNQVGANFFIPWGDGQPDTAFVRRFVWKPWGDLYADVSYYSFFANFIGQAHARQGLRFFEAGNTSVSAYLVGYYYFDSKGLFVNNILDLGVGMQLIPYNKVNLAFRVEQLHGWYIRRSGPIANPNASEYNDTRVDAEFFMHF